MRQVIVSLCLFVVMMVSHHVVLAASLPDFSHLVKKAAPAVVNITATREERDQRFDRFDDRDVPDLFRRFFREFQPPSPRPSAGSGFIVSSDGYILTNHHVVDGADEIIVALADRRERVARLIGADQLSDLALLKIDEKNLPTLQVGNSSSLEPGNWVLAIGSPFGFEYSVTAGIVSAIGRSLPDASGSYVPFIQTDVAINPGNSGGPLLNLDGKVIGINSQIFTRSGGFMGLSFAIPMDVAREVMKQLKEKGSVDRGWLGVLIQRVDRDLAESFSLDRPAGALISQVFSDSPAEEAGLQEGDIILEFDDKKIDLSAELPQVVGMTRPGEVVDVLIVRSGKKQKLKLTVGLLPDNPVAATTESQGSTTNPLAVDVRALSIEEKRNQDVRSGVLVTRVYPGPASEAGIRQGDVITLIDNERVQSVSEFEAVLSGLPRDMPIPLRIVRSGSPLFLVVKLAEE